MDLDIGPVKVCLGEILQFHFSLFRPTVATLKTTQDWFQIENKTTSGGIGYRETN